MTKSSLPLKVLAGLLLAFVGNASADIVSNVPNGANSGSPFVSFGNAANPSSDSPKVGEVFAWNSAYTLDSFNFYAVGNQNASLQLNVAQWNYDTNAKNQATNLVGPSLLTTTAATSEVYDSTDNFTTLAFNNLGLSLNAGTKYIAYLTSSDPALTGLQLSRTQTSLDVTGFGIGNGYLSTIPGQGWQLPFSGNGFLSLQYTAALTPIPEPSTYAAAMGLLSLGFVAIRRRNRVAV